MKLAALAATLAALPALGQEAPGRLQTEEPPAGVALAEGALVRGLDKVTGEIVDFELAEGESARLGRLTISAGECRYPADDPSSNAYAWLTILDDVAPEPVFQGWMIAAAPALNALDHARYDVWLIRCSISEG